MNSDEATVAVIDALQALDVPYILVGSLASNLYGIPRSTNDADFSVQVGAGGIRAIVARLGSSSGLTRRSRSRRSRERCGTSSTSPKTRTGSSFSV